MKKFGCFCGNKITTSDAQVTPPSCTRLDQPGEPHGLMTLLRDTGAVVAGPLLQAQIDEGAPGNGFSNCFGRTIEEQMAHDRAGFLEAPNLAFSITKGAVPAPSSLSFFVSDGTAWPLGKGAGRCIDTSGAGSQCKLPLHHSGYHRDGGGVWGGLQELATEDFDANTEQLKEHVRKTDDLRIMSRKEAEQAKMKADWEAAKEAGRGFKIFVDPKDTAATDELCKAHAVAAIARAEKAYAELAPLRERLNQEICRANRLADKLGDKDARIGELEREVGRLALDARRAGR